MSKIIHFQVGKNGLTEGIINSFKLAFKNTSMIKVSFLKSSKRTTESVEQDGQKIVEALGNNYLFHRIGFTLTVRRWRRAVR